jgi:hypothetical protein
MYLLVLPKRLSFLSSPIFSPRRRPLALPTPSKDGPQSSHQRVKAEAQVLILCQCLLLSPDWDIFLDYSSFLIQFGSRELLYSIPTTLGISEDFTVWWSRPGTAWYVLTCDSGLHPLTGSLDIPQFSHCDRPPSHPLLHVRQQVHFIMLQSLWTYTRLDWLLAGSAPVISTA